MSRLFRAFCDTEKDFRYETDIKEYAQKIEKANLELMCFRISRYIPYNMQSIPERMTLRFF